MNVKVAGFFGPFAKRIFEVLSFEKLKGIKERESDYKKLESFNKEFENLLEKSTDLAHKNIDNYFHFLKSLSVILKKYQSIPEAKAALKDLELEFKKIEPERMKFLVEQQKMVGSSTEEVQKNCEIAQVAITEDMKKVLGNNLDLPGLAYATKSFESLNRKITTGWGKLNESQKKKYNDNIFEYIKENGYDAIRYTANTTLGSIYKDWEKIMQNLKHEGYECVWVGNYWLNDKSSYKGVNMTFSSPYGYDIEIQMHTPEDKKSWHENHEIYEIFRKDDTSKQSKEIAELVMKMKLRRILGNKVPKDIDKIKM